MVPTGAACAAVISGEGEGEKVSAGACGIQVRSSPRAGPADMHVEVFDPGCQCIAGLFELECPTGLRTYGGGVVLERIDDCGRPRSSEKPTRTA